MKNLALKIGCVVVATLVWILVATTTMVEADVELPVETVGLEETWTTAGNTMPAESRVRVRVAKLALIAHEYFGLSLGTVQMDLANFAPGGTAQYEFKESDVRTDAEVITILPPVRWPLRLDWQDQRRLPVRVPLRGQLPSDMQLGGEVLVEPDSLTVSGPRRFFGGVDSLRTEAVDLSSLTGNVDQDVPLILPPTPLQVEQETVTVRIPLVRLAERVIANVPVLASEGEEPSTAGVSPPVCDVLVRGPADSVAVLSPAQLRVAVPVSGLGPGVHQASGVVDHPAWVIAVRLEPGMFMVIVEGEVEDAAPRREPDDEAEGPH